MLTYRCYLVDHGQRIIGAELIEADDDARAVERAEALCEVRYECSGIELWERARRIHVYERRGNGASSTGGSVDGAATGA